jgi:hypothetical protein
MTPSDQIVPYGYCHCGCGQKTSIVVRDIKWLGLIKGHPRRFVKGHQGRIRPTVEVDMRFKLDGIPCCLISLTKGQWTIVWESDYEWAMQWKWCASWNPSTRNYYAVRRGPRVNGKNGKLVWMHRELLGLKSGDEREGDHEDPLRTLENTRTNLRFASSSQQKQNTRLRRDNQCGLKGVCFDDRRGMWKAQICVNGVHKWLGYHRTKEAAYETYCEAAKMYFREFARVA